MRPIVVSSYRRCLSPCRQGIGIFHHRLVRTCRHGAHANFNPETLTGRHRRDPLSVLGEKASNPRPGHPVDGRLAKDPWNNSCFTIATRPILARRPALPAALTRRGAGSGQVRGRARVRWRICGRGSRLDSRAERRSTLYRPVTAWSRIFVFAVRCGHIRSLGCFLRHCEWPVLPAVAWLLRNKHLFLNTEAAYRRGKSAIKGVGVSAPAFGIRWSRLGTSSSFAVWWVCNPPLHSAHHLNRVLIWAAGQGIGILNDGSYSMGSGPVIPWFPSSHCGS